MPRSLCASIRLELEGAQVGPVVYRIDLRFLSGNGKTYRIESSGNLREWEALESDIRGNNLHIERTYFFNRFNLVLTSWIFTKIVLLADAVQLFPSVPETEYVVVVLGNAVTEFPEFVFSVLWGCQL